jgi:hypothetical protein
VVFVDDVVVVFDGFCFIYTRLRSHWALLLAVNGFALLGILLQKLELFFTTSQVTTQGRRKEDERTGDG